VISATSFLIALCLFAFSSGQVSRVDLLSQRLDSAHWLQHLVTSVVTTASTSLSSFGILTVSALYIRSRPGSIDVLRRVQQQAMQGVIWMARWRRRDASEEMLPMTQKVANRPPNGPSRTPTGAKDVDELCRLLSSSAAVEESVLDGQPVRHLRFSPNGRYLAVSDGVKSITVVNLDVSACRWNL
jgi:hypothetical protein